MNRRLKPTVIDNLKKAALINQSRLVSPKILRKIGGKLEVTGFKDEALHYYRKAFDLDGDSAYYLSCLGSAESDLGNYDKSIGYFKRAYMNRPELAIFCSSAATKTDHIPLADQISLLSIIYK